MNLTPAFPTFIVTLREGFEAALVVGIVMASLRQVKQTRLYRQVYLGIGLGIGGSIILGFLLAIIIQSIETNGGIYSALIKQLLASMVGIIAIAMLSWMLLWMSKQSKFLKTDIQETVNQALNNQDAGKSIFLLVAIAVLREGFETVLFILAKFDQQWQLPAIGAIVGLCLAAFLGWLLFAWGVKLNLRLFFLSMGILLLLIVGGLVLSVSFHLDQSALIWQQTSAHHLCLGSNDSCLLGQQIWDGSSILPDHQFPGMLLKALFGYRQTLYLGQVSVYIMFMSIMGVAYLNSLNAQFISVPWLRNLPWLKNSQL